MNQIRLLVFASAAMLVLGSCGGKKNKTQYEDIGTDTSYGYVSRDSTIYGLCGEGSAMNTLQLLTDNGDTLNLSVADAKENGQCFGNYSVGDRMAVMLGADSTVAREVINVSALFGSWVMPNPIDGSDETGIKIKEGGIAESIEQSSIIYRSWKIYNGQLEIISIREGGTEQEETNFYNLVRLTPDSLVYRDSEDTYEYGRQQVHKPYSDIELDDSSIDDFKM